jgi:pimeloyl-ACP methyl ester carboxylesterase
VVPANGSAWRTIVIEAGVGYLDEGHGPPVVLLMGLGAPATAWAPHIAAWSQRYRCIAIDNRGAGETPLGCEPLSTRLMASDAERLIDALGLAAVRVVGISMGACIAQELALARPDLVSSMALVAPWARCDAFTRSVLQVLARVRATDDSRAFTELLRNTVWTPNWINDHALAMDPDLQESPSMSSAAFAAQALACIEHDTDERLPGLRTRTLVTMGSADVFIRDELSQRVVDRLPDSEARAFAGLGHVHHWEALETFNELVEEWMQ